MKIGIFFSVVDFFYLKKIEMILAISKFYLWNSVAGAGTYLICLYLRNFNLRKIILDGFFGHNSFPQSAGPIKLPSKCSKFIRVENTLETSGDMPDLPTQKLKFHFQSEILEIVGDIGIILNYFQSWFYSILRN